MKPISVIAIFIISLLIIASIANTIMIVKALDSKVYDHYKQVYTIIETTIVKNEGSTNVSVINTLGSALPYPQNDPFQKLLSYKTYINGRNVNISIYKELNGLITIAELTQDIMLAPGEEANITVVYKVMLNVNRTIPRDTLLKFMLSGWDSIHKFSTPKILTEPTSLWNYNNPLISMLAEYLRSKSRTPSEYIFNCIEWIMKKVVYETRIPPRHPIELLIEFKGDCDDQANLLITLLRYAGIPTIIEQGLVIMKNVVVKGTAANGYLQYYLINAGPHGWVKAQIGDNTWIAIDMTFPYMTNKPIDKILLAAYYTFPVVVTYRTYKEDYVSEGTAMLQDIEERRVMVIYSVNVTFKTG